MLDGSGWIPVALAEAARFAVEVQSVSLIEPEAVSHGDLSAATLTLSGLSVTSAASKKAVLSKQTASQMLQKGGQTCQ